MEPKRTKTGAAGRRKSGPSAAASSTTLPSSEVAQPDPADFAIAPPIEPMLAKLAEELPPAGDILYEPKWDGFRAIVFRGETGVYIQSRDSRPLDRYFPELHHTLLEKLPPGCVIDGEIVIASANGLDFDALQLRLHPAASRVAKLANDTPASFVGFDLLAVDGSNIIATPQSERRGLLQELLAGTGPPVYLTPMTRDRDIAVEWLARFEGAGLDGVIAKPADLPYQPGKRAMIKVKHARTADCVVAGFRWHKSGGDVVGSLLLGLYDDRGALHHVGVTSSFTMAMRRQLAVELAPLRDDALARHPWRDWAEAAHARRPEPLDRRQRPVVGAAADRARVRGQIRSSAGNAFSPCRDFSAMAPRQTARRLPLRSARGHERLRAAEGFRGGGSAALTGRELSGSSSGSSASCGGRSSTGTRSRLTRMRVQVE